MTIARSDSGYFKRLGSRLRKLREERGWSLEKAEEEGFSDWKYLQRIEAGRNITLATLLKIASLYDQEPWEILKGIRKEK